MRGGGTVPPGDVRVSVRRRRGRRRRCRWRAGRGRRGLGRTHGRARVRVRRCLLGVPQWNAGVEGGSDESVAQGVRADRLIDASATGDPSHDPARAVVVHPVPVRSQEDRAVESLADGEVDCSGGAWRERDRDDLAALAQHGQGAVPRSRPSASNVRAQSLGDAQPVDREQRDQGVLVGCAETGGDE